MYKFEPLAKIELLNKYEAMMEEMIRIVIFAHKSVRFQRNCGVILHKLF